MGCRARNVDRFGLCNNPDCKPCRTKGYPAPPETLMETEIRYLRNLGVTVTASDVGKLGQGFGAPGMRNPQN